MKRMVDTKFIKWIKSLFKSIQPGTKDGDVEIGGNLEVDGYFYPSIKLLPYSGDNFGVELSPYNSGYYNILEVKGLGISEADRRTPRLLSGSKYAKIWASPDSAGYYCNAQLMAYSVDDNNGWAGVGIIHTDAIRDSFSALDIGFAQQFTGYSTYNNYLILNDRLEVKKTDNFLYNISTPLNLKTSEELTTSGEGSATLVSTRLEKEELYIGGHTTIHASLTEALGNATSGQITFTGKGLTAGKAFTGVLLKGDTLVGACYAKINSATEIVLYYQNPLGATLEGGDYTANLNLIAEN